MKISPLAGHPPPPAMLFDGSLGFGGEESAGAAFLRRDGTAWTTDKDGIVPALLAAEITARAGRDPGEIYHDLTRQFGAPVSDRVEASATPAQKKLRLSRRNRCDAQSWPGRRSRAPSMRLRETTRRSEG